MNDLTTLNHMLLNIFEQMFSYLKQIYELSILENLDNPMSKIVLAFVPAILGIAYPIILQTVGRLNDTYKSTHIVDRLKFEFRFEFFRWALLFSIICSLSSIFLNLFNYLIAYMALVILLIAFFRLIDLLSKYQNVKDLSKRFIDKSGIGVINYTPKPCNNLLCEIFNHLRGKLGNPHTIKNYSPNQKEKLKDRLLKYWHPMIDLLNYAIRNEDKKLEEDIIKNFIIPAFDLYKFYSVQKTEYIEYPKELLNSSHDVIVNLLKFDDQQSYHAFEYFIGTLYLREEIGDDRHLMLNRETLATIWSNLLKIVESQRHDIIMRFWRQMHQYANFSLSLYRPKLDENFQEIPASKKKFNQLQDDKEKIIQLHTVLGAYLYYKKEYGLLKKLINHTQSVPRQYFLLPDSFGQILKIFSLFSTNDIRYIGIHIQYWFKDLEFDSIYEKHDVKFFVQEYLGMLLLRLYQTRNSHFSSYRLSFPEIPEKAIDRDKKKQDLEKLKSILKRLLDDNELINVFGFEKITSKDLESEIKYNPVELVDEYIRRLSEKSNKELESGELDNEKIEELKNNTVTAIGEVFKDISRVAGKKVVKPGDEDATSKYMQVIRGKRILLDRDAFIKDSNVHHLNADSILGYHLKQEYYLHFITKLFSQKRIQNYKVPYGKVFEAVDKLNLVVNDYIIIGIGINIDYLAKYQGVDITKNGEKNSYNYIYENIPVYIFNFNHPLTRDTLYILKKEYCPMVKHINWTEIKNLSEEALTKWESMGKPLDEVLNIYMDIKELNTDEVLREEYMNNGQTKEELKNKLEIDVDFLAYIWFPKDTEIIEIKQAEPFQEGGKIDQIEDIKPLPKDKKSN